MNHLVCWNCLHASNLNRARWRQTLQEMFLNEPGVNGRFPEKRMGLVALRLQVRLRETGRPFDECDRPVRGLFGDEQRGTVRGERH